MKIFGLFLSVLALVLAVYSIVYKHRLFQRIKRADWLRIDEVVKDKNCVLAKDCIMTEEWVDDGNSEGRKVIRIFPKELANKKFKVVDDRWLKNDDETIVGIIDKFLIED